MIRSAALPAGPATEVDDRGLRISIRLTVTVLALAVGAVIAASFSAALALIQVGVTRADLPEALDQISRVTKFLLKFDAGGEQTVTAWLSSMILLLCSLMLYYIANMQRQRGGAYAWHWLGLSLIFCGLSMDEAVGLHEMTIDPMRELFGASGIFLYAWVIPALAFVALVGIAYLGFLRHLEPSFRLRFVIAGALFAGAAIGFEMVEGALADFYLQHRLIHEIAVHLEDATEFAGELVFLHALLLYACRYAPRIVVRLT
jgi:hypothetical protein